MLLADGAQPVAQVVGIVVEEAALLDKIYKHHAVKHERGVPFAVGQDFDAFDEAEKVLMLIFEVVVEAFGDLFDVEGGAHAAGDVDN